MINRDQRPIKPTRHRPLTARRVCAVSLLAALAVLSGCDLGPEYKRPNTAMPVTWRASEASPAWPSADWWQGFSSAQLDAFIAQAQKANYDLAAAIAQVREADAQVRIAGASLLPSLTAGGGVSAGRIQGSESGGKGSGKIKVTDYTLAPTASYELDFWGKNRAGLESAKASAVASRYNQQVVDLTVVAGVADTYFQIVGFQDQLKVAEQNLDNGQRVLKGIELEFSAGTATQLDVAQQETVVAGLKAAIPPLQQQLAQNIDALAILLGKSPEEVSVPETSLASLSIPAVAPGLPSELLTRRPDVRDAEEQLVAANANIKVARAQFFPSITLTGAGGLESTALSTLFTPGAGIYTLAASFTQPIFEGGSLTGQLELSKARYDELLQDYRKSVISAFGDVENALVATQKTAEQETDQAETVAKAQQAFDISDIQYRAGTITVLTVLNTENALFAAENALVQDRLARMQALVSLFNALGGGWKDNPALTDAH